MFCGTGYMESETSHLFIYPDDKPEHGLVNISSRMTLDFSNLATGILLSKFTCRKLTEMSMYLFVGVTLSAKIVAIKIFKYIETGCLINL